jgi:myo-inositol-1(or 4)-monophosphatase
MEAGRALLFHQGRLDRLNIVDKAGGQGTVDWVSDADRAADEVLARDLPGVVAVPYWSEERGARPQTDSFWLCDPLDGTNNFLSGLPLYGVSVALIEHGEAVCAVSHFPALGWTAAAESGCGTWINGRRVRLRAVPLAHWLVELASQPNDAAHLTALVGLLQRVRAVRIVGSIALSLAWVASGQLDLFVGRGYPWDVAAGMLLVAEAGGESRSFGGAARNPLDRDRMICGHPDHVRTALATLTGTA